MHDIYKDFFIFSSEIALQSSQNLLQLAMDIKNNSRLMFYVLLMSFIKFHVSFGSDTISANQYLSGDQTIVSAGGVFELGFFTPGKSSYNYNYIGIWFKKGSEQTIVWVANRDKPIFDRYSSVLKISDCNLVLFNESRIPIWSTNLSLTTSSSVEAVLLDEGNLVLKKLSDNSSNPLWQSFDYPTHTWLPGMKIGFNKRTKVNRRLVSWKNKEDPSPGLFSFELDPSGSNQYLMLWNRSERYWSSGEWNGGTFKFTPNVTYLQKTYPFKVYFVSNENETYFMYTVKDPIFIIGLIMGASGQIKQMFGLKASKTWFQFWLTPAHACEVHAICGAFSICSEQTQPLCACLEGFKQNSEQDWNLQDYSGGCVRKTQLQCVNNSLTDGKSDGFLANANMLLPNYPQSVPVRSIEECGKTCLNDCSCTAYAYENDECSIWLGNLLNQRKLAKGDPNGKTVYIKLSASEISSAANDNINKGTVIGGVVGSIVASLVILSFIMFVYLRRRNRRSKSIEAEEGSLVAFAYKDLQNATKNFSEKLGKGGFGSVFKGVLPNSRFIGVKKLESLSQGEKEFRTEVRTIGNIQHVNLVQLHGFCTQGNRRLLVYEYMPNGSLNSHLFHEKDSKILDWETRYKIALGTAKGLAYLHEECRDCIIHCDIKPENILLDAEFCPKVADFGLAKLHGREFSRVLTSIRGTRGYLAPEWLSGNAITTKADVYSYGMMLFEFVSGRRNSELITDEKVEYFPTWAASIIANEGGDVLSLLDPKLEGNADAEEVRRICKVACWCIQDDETHRPSMGQVVRILEGVLDLTLPPIPTSLQVFADNQEFLLFFRSESTQ